MNPLRVLVLDDSLICRSQMRRMLESDGDISVVGEDSSGTNVLELLRQTRAQLLVVDAQMPKVNGHQTISTVMAHTPLPILVVTGEPLGEGRSVVFESIRRGALELSVKPDGKDLEAQRQLRETVRRLARIPVVRHVAGKLLERPPDPPALRRSVPPTALGQSPLTIGIGSSAGGPLPLSLLLGELSERLDAALVLVQHLPAGFFPAFADFVQGRTKLRVQMVRGSTTLEEGTIYVPSRDTHLTLTSPSTLSELDSSPRQGHRPSVDVLFESLAKHQGPRAAGVILSGIGQDGTQGLLAMRRAGSFCLGQDRESSAVWGMPKAALEAGAVEHTQSPLGLAALLEKWVQVNAKNL